MQLRGSRAYLLKICLRSKEVDEWSKVSRCVDNVYLDIFKGEIEDKIERIE